MIYKCNSASVLQAYTSGSLWKMEQNSTGKILSVCCLIMVIVIQLVARKETAGRRLWRKFQWMGIRLDPGYKCKVQKLVVPPMAFPEKNMQGEGNLQGGNKVNAALDGVSNSPQNIRTMQIPCIAILALLNRSKEELRGTGSNAQCKISNRHPIGPSGTCIVPYVRSTDKPRICIALKEHGKQDFAVNAETAQRTSLWACNINDIAACCRLYVTKDNRVLPPWSDCHRQRLLLSHVPQKLPIAEPPCSKRCSSDHPMLWVSSLYAANCCQGEGHRLRDFRLGKPVHDDWAILTEVHGKSRRIAKPVRRIDVRGERECWCTQLPFAFHWGHIGCRGLLPKADAWISAWKDSKTLNY